jgi:hypothetical protein
MRDAGSADMATATALHIAERWQQLDPDAIELDRLIDQDLRLLSLPLFSAEHG